MKINFLIDQMEFLKNCIDLEIKKGVCAAMVMEWVKRELKGEPQSALHYSSLNKFASLQRAMHYRKNNIDIYQRPFKSDNIDYVELKLAHHDNFEKIIAPLLPGVFTINVFTSSRVGHAIGLSFSNGKYKLFDPNIGEFMGDYKSSEDQALFYISKFFSSTYCSSGFKWMQLIKFNKKKDYR